MVNPRDVAGNAEEEEKDTTSLFPSYSPGVIILVRVYCACDSLAAVKVVIFHLLVMPPAEEGC